MIQNSVCVYVCMCVWVCSRVCVRVCEYSGLWSGERVQSSWLDLYFLNRVYLSDMYSELYHDIYTLIDLISKTQSCKIIKNPFDSSHFMFELDFVWLHHFDFDWVHHFHFNYVHHFDFDQVHHFGFNSVHHSNFDWVHH